MKSTAATELIERQAICLLLHAQAQAGLREDQKLGARVDAVDVRAGIGLGVAERLRFFQRGVEAGAVLFHFGEDEVAGAVEDSGDFEKAVAREAFLNADDRGNATRDGGAEFEALAHFAREVEQLGPVFGNQQLVGGDHGFTGAQRLAHPFPGRLEAADQLDDDVRVGGQHVVEIFRPANRARAANLIFFFLMLRLKMCVRTRGPPGSSSREFSRRSGRRCRSRPARPSDDDRASPLFAGPGTSQFSLPRAHFPQRNCLPDRRLSYQRRLRYGSGNPVYCFVFALYAPDSM